MKVLVLDNYESFSIVPYLKEKMDCDVLKMGNIYESRFWDIFKKAEPDMVFVDFCDRNALLLTHQIGDLLKKPKIVIRLHGYEAFSNYLDVVNWDVVADLVVVSPTYEKIVRKRLENVNTRIHTVYNGVDINKFKLQENSVLDNNNVAILSHLNRKKGIALLRTVIASMPEWSFHVGGSFQEEPVKLYLEDLELNNVQYYGLVRNDEFLKGKRYIMSTSVSESFGMSIAEGMAMGLTPLVHGWPGARDLWPEECVWNTFEELKNIKPMNAVKCREWIENRYSMDDCIDRLIDILQNNLEVQKDG